MLYKLFVICGIPGIWPHTAWTWFACLQQAGILGPDAQGSGTPGFIRALRMSLARRGPRAHQIIQKTDCHKQQNCFDSMEEEIPQQTQPWLSWRFCAAGAHSNGVLPGAGAHLWGWGRGSPPAAQPTHRGAANITS